jgi:hypothetical protein
MTIPLLDAASELERGVCVKKSAGHFFRLVLRSGRRRGYKCCLGNTNAFEGKPMASPPTIDPSAVHDPTSRCERPERSTDQGLANTSIY